MGKIGTGPRASGYALRALVRWFPVIFGGCNPARPEGRATFVDPQSSQTEILLRNDQVVEFRDLDRQFDPVSFLVIYRIALSIGIT